MSFRRGSRCAAASAARTSGCATRLVTTASAPSHSVAPSRLPCSSITCHGTAGVSRPTQPALSRELLEQGGGLDAAEPRDGVAAVPCRRSASGRITDLLQPELLSADREASAGLRPAPDLLHLEDLLLEPEEAWAWTRPGFRPQDFGCGVGSTEPGNIAMAGVLRGRATPRGRRGPTPAPRRPRCRSAPPRARPKSRGRAAPGWRAPLPVRTGRRLDPTSLLHHRSVVVNGTTCTTRGWACRMRRAVTITAGGLLATQSGPWRGFT